MHLGIFAKTFPGDIETNMSATVAAGIESVQYNLSIAGIDTVPEHVPAGTLDRIADAATAHGIELAAISGTFNTAHPDPAVRALGIERFPVLAAAAATLKIPVVTLSSGSRDPEDMWRHHDNNSTAEAWNDSRTSLRALAAIAQDQGITVAFEPEHTNVVSTAALARTMLDEVGSRHLGIVFDAANLIDTADLSRPTITRIVDHALGLLGRDIVLAHAKELVVDRAQVAPGEGFLPWRYILAALAETGYRGAVVTHGLPAARVPIAVDTLGPLLSGDPTQLPTNRTCDAATDT